MDLQLRDRVAVVTGGASGIGRACVDALVAEGALVGIIDTSPDGEAIARAHNANGARVCSATGDVTDEASVTHALDSIVRELGPIDTLIGCAGISGPVGTRIAAIDVEAWDQVMAVNVRGNFLAAKHALPHLEVSEIGTIVLLASDSAFVAYEGMAPYTASKAAVVALVKAIAIDHPKIRANAICPGIVDTPMARRDLGRPLGFANTPLPVMAPHQLAKQVVYLASPISAPTNATTLVTDFGYLARPALGALDFEPAPGIA